jgi:hypothetical protein
MTAKVVTGRKLSDESFRPFCYDRDINEGGIMAERRGEGGPSEREVLPEHLRRGKHSAAAQTEIERVMLEGKRKRGEIGPYDVA